MFKDSKLRKMLMAGGVVGIVALVFGGVVWAQGGMGPMGRQHRMGAFGMGPGGPGMMLGRMARQLDLTDVQRQDIRGILQSHQADFQALRQEGVTLHQQLRTAIVNNDPAAIESLAGPLGQFQVKMAKLHAQVRSEVFAKLTPEQQAKAKDLETRFETRMKTMQERWQQRGRPS